MSSSKKYQQNTDEEFKILYNLKLFQQLIDTKLPEKATYKLEADLQMMNFVTI